MKRVTISKLGLMNALEPKKMWAFTNMKMKMKMKMKIVLKAFFRLLFYFRHSANKISVKNRIRYLCRLAETQLEQEIWSSDHYTFYLVFCSTLLFINFFSTIAFCTFSLYTRIIYLIHTYHYLVHYDIKTTLYWIIIAMVFLVFSTAFRDFISVSISKEDM